MRRLKNKKGFTIVEVLITVTMLMIIGAAVAGLMYSMATASANQRRRQAEHANEENARMALLNVVRDVRMSSGATVAGNVLTLTARVNDVNYVFTYSLEPYTGGDGFYIPNPTSMLVRNFTTGTEDDWATATSNPFTRTIVHGFTPTIIASPVDSRVGIRIDLAIPNIGAEVPPELMVGVPEGFRRWTLNSAASYKRIPGL
jgi:type II secretory pathway pseudopilin PulG